MERSIEEVQAAMDVLREYKSPKIQEAMEVIESVVAPMIAKERAKQYKEERNLKYSWNGFNPHLSLSRMEKDISSVETYYNEVEDLAKYASGEIQDILHYMELKEPSEEEMLELAYQLQAARRERRKGKDMQSLLAPYLNVVRKNRKLLNDLQQAVKETREIKEKMDRRTYTPRAMTAMEAAFAEAEGKLDQGAEEVACEVEVTVK